MFFSLQVAMVSKTLRARSDSMESSPGIDPARNVALFYTAEQQQEQFRPGLRLNERALSEIRPGKELRKIKARITRMWDAILLTRCRTNQPRYDPY